MAVHAIPIATVPGRLKTGFDVSILLFLLAVLGTGLILFMATRDPAIVAAFVAGLLGTAALLRFTTRTDAAASLELPTSRGTDPALLRPLLDSAGGEAALALTNIEGELICANSRWMESIAGASPLDLGLGECLREVRRDQSITLRAVRASDRTWSGEVRTLGDWVLWRLQLAESAEPATETMRMLESALSRKLGEAGVMLVLTDARGLILATNPAFDTRAIGDEGGYPVGHELVEYLATPDRGQFRLASESDNGPPLRIIQVTGGAPSEGPCLFLMFEDVAGPRFGEDENAHIHALLDSLPLGLALADIDGRFTFLNKAFRKAAGLAPADQPAWPGDLVVNEDKSVVSDAVRRFGRGRVPAGDLAVRLLSNPEEPVAMTVAGARGLGNAAALISLKDNSEEARLKREIAQATKMQAVGQLAGGVAHDFNNILTAILGTCDLMLMRHTPGDSDYDDIQQIRSNSNRAANLTRQLLAFSRQQTLRPQILQLPDVVAEVSHLLTRLLGEKVRLEVKHGRGLGAVRADPGQLEQVIVNLAVNARDAILAKDADGGGALTLHTFSVTAEEIGRMGTDILPIGDYTALRVSDTGIGIPAGNIGKIFEPFFTTKEVGKGTGLGLSTVYGIVKQSGGFIFAESQPGKGTAFTIYLPVHRVQAGEPAAMPSGKEKPSELWGSGNILLVEDEAMVRTVAERALSRQGYTVLVAENGEAALEQVGKESEIDLMICDVVMPTMDGPTTAAEVRKRYPNLPILFISGYAEEQLRKSIDMPGVAFLAKPFSVQELAETVKGILSTK
ncbi:MAG: response regulator [Sphingosinicella sp.]